MAGLDPAIHAADQFCKLADAPHARRFSMDYRVKPGSDELIGLCIF